MKKVRKVIPLLCKTPQQRVISSFTEYVGQPKRQGQFNGYLAIPMEIWNKIKLESDPDRIYETNYDLVPDIGIMAHGWWAYGEQFNDFSTDDAFIPMLDIRKVDTTNYMIIGFDTCHFSDNYDNWTAKAVREHTFELYDALVKYIKSK